MRVLQEANQEHHTRKALYKRIEKQLGVNKKVVGFFTTFDWPVQLGDKDADMLEEVLHNCCVKTTELVLILNCPGGDALAAERIIRICRSYSKRGFAVIIPKAAKSAATMVCLGADNIGMSSTSELGPIDPQIQVGDRYYAAHEIIESYDDLMRKANTTTGKVDPYLQQLYRFESELHQGAWSSDLS
jgi:ClpP class serine protease